MTQNPALACNSFFTLQSTVNSNIRRGWISIPSLASEGVSTPCLLVRTSRFLSPHLTPDNLDLTVPADSSILEMNFDYILENQALLNTSPLSIAKIAGVDSIRATCLATRLISGKEVFSTNLINGDDFVTVQNSSGSQKFELKCLSDILQRFMPDFFIGAFDSHQVPMSLKRIHRSVDRNLKYEVFSASASKAFKNLPFISSILGADNLAEKERNISSISEFSSGIAFSDLHKLPTLEERISLIKATTASHSARNGLLRILRGPVSPSEMIHYLPYVDIFDTSFVDDLTSKGLALQLNPENNISCTEYLNLWDECHFDNFKAISESCDCLSCKKYTRSYIHHLFKSHEMLAGVLLTIHNLRQYYRWLEHLKKQ